MIKFFRHIRKSLLMKNKTSQYFKYAIGEIVLVVIGILIALQINNWNENRKAVENERILLQKLKEENSLNLNSLSEYVEYRDSISSVIDKFLVLLHSKNIEKKSSKIEDYLDEILASSVYTFTQSNLVNYLNANTNKSSALSRELTTLQFYEKDLELASTKGVDIKIKNVFEVLDNSLDFASGEIVDFKVLKSLQFKNKILLIASVENEISNQFKKTYKQIKKVDSIITSRLIK